MSESRIQATDAANNAAPSDTQPRTPTERTNLLSWRNPTMHAGSSHEEAAPKISFLDHIARFTHISPSHQPAQEHAHHIWALLDPYAEAQPSYRPGIADLVRLDGLLNSVQFALLAYSVAGALDALAPSGMTIFNPEGTRHSAVGMACILGAVVTPLTLGTPIAGNLYGALLHGCNVTEDRLRAHFVSTRLVGYMASLTFFTASLVGAGLIKRSIDINKQSQVPDQPAHNDVYEWAGFLSLLVASPGFAALGWYAGRIGSAACHKRP